MLTRCPHCATAFRVGPEQLKKRQGRVRCGACHQVFDALDGLIEVTAPGSSPEPESAPGSMNIAPLAPLVEVAMPAQQPVVAEAVSESVSPTPTTPVAPHQCETADPAQPEPVAEIDPAISDTAMSPAQPQMAQAATGGVEAGDSSTDAGHWAAAVQALEAPVHRAPPTGKTRRASRVALSLACLLALGTLLAQAAYHLRVELTTQLPLARPWLQRACESLGCQIGLPTDAERLGIESSDLNPEPGDTTRLRLVATLRNRAPYAQGWPHLELTLTDANDQALARRVIVPDEYLTHLPSARSGDGFSAQSELTLTLPLATKHAAAAGYRLYLFYP